MFLDKPSYIQKIEQALSPVLLEGGYELVQAKLSNEFNSWVLKFLVDREGGITVEECAKLSREFKYILAVENIAEIRTKDYILEVSSPGLDRPLTRIQDFERFLGSKVKLKVQGSPSFHSGRKNFKGEIKCASERDFTLLLAQGEEVKIPFQDIEEAHLMIDLPIQSKAGRNSK
ncbi:MAG: ribosome maturation factor RimP [Deltaproteobacteria bacterium]|nr:ribosome maturation factor RimP [Deltaproteobacteria bacterium]